MRAPRTDKQRHAGLLGSTIALAAIAGFAGSNEIFPGVSAALTAGDNVIYSQVMVRPTVSTTKSIPSEDILSGERDVFVWHRHIPHEADDTGERILGAHGAQLPVRAGFYDFGFLLENKDHSAFPCRNMDRLIVIVEYEDRHSPHFGLNNEIRR